MLAGGKLGAVPVMSFSILNFGLCSLRFNKTVCTLKGLIQYTTTYSISLLA